jgi:predicted Zn-dependent peptidase
MCSRIDPRYYATDLASDILGRGKSSRLYHNLVQERKLFNDISAFITGSIDPGLLVIAGKVNPEVELEEADKAVEEEINTLFSEGISERELQKVKNQAISTLEFSKIQLLSRCMGLAFSKMLGNPNLMNTEAEILEAVTPEEVMQNAKEVLHPSNCSTLYYKGKS